MFAISTFFLSLFSYLYLSIISNIAPIQSVSSGGFHNIAITLQGKVFSWRYNWYGQLGDGTYRNEKYRPLLVIV